MKNIGLFVLIFFAFSFNLFGQANNSVLFPIQKYYLGNPNMNRFGYIDSLGTLKIPFRYTYASEFSNERAEVQDNNQTQRYFINISGNKIADEIMGYGEDIVTFKLNGKWGLMDDKTSKVIIDPIYDFANYYTDISLAVVKKEEYSGCIDKLGNIIVPIQYNDIRQFRNGFCAVQKDGKWGYVNTKGIEVIPTMYEDFHWFCEGIVAVNLNNKWGYIDSTNQTVIPFSFKEVSRFSENIASVKMESLWGFIDKKGKLKIDYQFDDTGLFSEGLCTVKKNGKWGVIDTLENLVVPYQIKDTRDICFEKGLLSVYLDMEKGNYSDEDGMINRKGEIICEDCSFSVFDSPFESINASCELKGKIEDS